MFRLILTFSRLMIYIYVCVCVCVSYRTADLQMLHLYIQQIYVLNILNMLHTLRLFLSKMPFIS